MGTPLVETLDKIERKSAKLLVFYIFKSYPVYETG